MRANQVRCLLRTMNTITERKICFSVQIIGSTCVSIYFCNAFLSSHSNKMLFAFALLVSLLNIINICLIHMRFLVVMRRVNDRIAALPVQPRMTQSEISRLPTRVFKREMASPAPSPLSAQSYISYQQLTPEDKSAQGSELCSICLNDFVIGDVLIPLPCSHMYHKTCLSMWLIRRNTCPLCSTAVVVTAAEEQHVTPAVNDNV